MRIVGPVTSEVQVLAGGRYNLGYHVWCLKYGRPVLVGRVAGRCQELACAEPDEHDWRILPPEIMPGQVRLFVTAHRFNCPRITDQFKRFTSRPLQTEFPHLQSPLQSIWSQLYFAATVGAVSAATVRGHTGMQNARPRRKERAR